MKKLLIGLFSSLLLCLVLTACQGMKEEQVRGKEEIHDEEHDHVDEHSNDEETQVGIKIEGLGALSYWR